MKLTDFFEIIRPTAERWQVTLEDRDGRNLVQETGTNKEAACYFMKEKLRAALRGSYAPLLISFRKESYFIYRDPQMGWVYSRVHQQGTLNEIQKPSLSVNGCYESKEEAIEYVRASMAKYCWDENEEQSPILTESQQEAFTQWAQWQKRYQVAKERGATDDEARDIASHMV